MIRRACRTLALLIGVVGAWGTQVASAQTQVVVTFDVESTRGLPLTQQIDPQCEGGPCGLMEMVRMLQARKMAGTFFLNVYEHPLFGEQALREIATNLQSAGQDVELHTHPETLYDSARTEMYQYSLDEQTEIVREGVRLIQAWTGQPVVAHRAGAYGADENTLIALERNGVLWDSSMFWQHPKSHLDALRQPRNLPWHHGQLTEIPVSVYRREDRAPLLGSVLAPVSVIRKIDVDWFIDETEARAAIDALVAAKVPVLVVFLHSFSFMDENAPPGTARADRHSIDMFRVILDEVSERNLPVITMSELAAQGLPPTPTDLHDTVPAVTVQVDMPHYLWRRFKDVDRLSLAAAAAALVIVVASAGFAFLRRRTRMQRSGASSP